MKRRSLSSPWLVGIGQRLAGSVLLAALVATAPACDPASAGHNHNHHHDDEEVAPQVELTALAKYVTTPDPAYSWKLRTTVTGTDYTTYFIDMTSQSWRSASEWYSPAAMDTTWARLATWTGALRLVVVPSPSWPEVLRPKA